MRSLIRLALAAGVAAIVGAALTPLFAQDTAAPSPPQMNRVGPGGPGGRGFGPGPGGPFGPIALPLRQLDLSDAQRDQVRAVMQSHEAAFKEIGDRTRLAREALDAAITADAVDESAIRARAADVAAVDADAAVLRARVHQEVFSLLTAEQQTKARALQAETRRKIKERGADARPRRNRGVQPA
jgi:protein CpxP